ncbi:MAG: HAD-IC family P-type ATPase [Clostridia bacterium]|nr:HAD-IC family P-type ATPase [Clostridia bacterium]
MSKIYYKKGSVKPAEDAEGKTEPAIAGPDDNSPPKEETAAGTAKAAAAGKTTAKSSSPKAATVKTAAAKPAETPPAAPIAEEEIAADVATDAGADLVPDENFDKEKILKYFKKHPKNAVTTKVERFKPDLNKGLNTAQVQKRFSQFLFNDSNKQYSKSYASIFVGNICTFFNLLCLLAFIALILAHTSGITNYLVIFMTTANIVVGIVQEIRSKRSIDKLSLLAANTVKAMRDSEVTEIPLNEIVLDDVIMLETGNQVPADCILASGSVEVNESLLTGESISIKKQVGDVLYAGSFISSGNGKFRVDKVGKETYLQKLTSKAKKYKKPNSELMNSTKLIIKVIGLLIIPVAIGIFLTAYHNYDPTSTLAAEISDWIFSAQINYAIQRTCSVVIGMIPSGMLLLTSIALAVGVIRLAKQNTLVQDLYSLEMLARVNVLCLDKTGTITDGRMKVNDCVILNTFEDLSVNDIMGSMLAALDDNNQTSIALQNHFGYSDKLNPVAKIPFSSARKLSAVTFEDAGTFCYGAPEFVLRPMPAKVERITKQYAQMGMRVLVLAHSSAAIQGDRPPAVMRPVAIISIADNIREDAISTIKWFKDNEVNVKVISGDNPVTVSEVARRAGISNADKFISLEGLNEKEVESVADSYTVFGRVTPEQKAILVRTLKSEGNTVAMTGDGVNDILAMKEADCAISVASGSEAARNVSHIVLMDNNFNNMPKVVGEGRRVINNIKNSSSLFLMKTLFTCILALLCIFMNTSYLFLPKNMLMIEMFVIGIPSFFLSLQPNNDRVKGKFISHVMSRSVPGAVLMVLCVMAMYLTNEFAPDEFGDYYLAMCMLALTFSGMVMLYRVCQPFNLYRGILYVLMIAAAVTCCCVPFLGDMLYDNWSKLEWDYSKILIVVVVVEAAFPISSWLIKILEIIMPSSTGKEKPKPAKQNN